MKYEIQSTIEKTSLSAQQMKCFVFATKRMRSTFCAGQTHFPQVGVRLIIKKAVEQKS